jgi:hypothetical protein
MHFLFNLLRIKGLYMSRALLANLQEALYKRHFVYCVSVMCVGFTRIGVELQSWCDTFGERIGAYRVLVEKPERMTPLG